MAHLFLEGNEVLEKGKNDFVRWMKDHHFSAEEQQQLTEILEQHVLLKWKSAGSELENIFPPAPPAIFLSGPTQTPKLRLLLEGEMEKEKGKEKERKEEENVQDSHIILASNDEKEATEKAKDKERVIADLKKMAEAANTEEASVVQGKLEELLQLNKQIKVPAPRPNNNITRYSTLIDPL